MGWDQLNLHPEALAPALRTSWGPWDGFIVHLGHGDGCRGTGQEFLVKFYEWVTSFVGTGNTSVKVMVWGLTEHGGHRVLMTIKHCLLTTKPEMTEK